MILHTIEQAAERVHRDPATIRRWIRTGILHAELEPLSGRKYVEDEALMAAERGARLHQRAGRFTTDRQPTRKAS
jgi:predicted site-specific integrase-resolvase